MALSAWFFGFVVASLLGALYHLWRGGGLARIVFYLGLAWVGFGGGVYLAHLNGWALWVIGQLDVGFGVLGSLLILGFGDWLTLTISEV